MTDLKPAILAALSPLPAACSLAYPRREMSLPVVTVADESASVAAQADGEPWLEEYAYSVQVYAADPAALETLTRAVDAALTALGLRRVSQQDFYDETAYAWRKSLRYRCLLQGDIICQ